MASDPERMIERLPQATIKVLERRWRDNVLTDDQARVLHRMLIETGDPTALRIEEVWRRVPPVPHGDMIDVEPSLRATAIEFGLDPDEWMQEFVGDLVERGFPIEQC